MDDGLPLLFCVLPGPLDEPLLQQLVQERCYGNRADPGAKRNFPSCWRLEKEYRLKDPNLFMTFYDSAILKANF